MRRATWVGMLLVALALQGCALPPVVMIASYSADIVSFAATGKTVTDHAYSAVARSDCSFIRILREKPICVDPPADGAAALAGDTAPRARAAAPAPAPARNRYVRIGSFLDRANAARSVARYAAFHPVTVPVTVRGRHFQRVTAGPLTADEAAALEEKMVAAAAPSRRG